MGWVWAAQCDGSAALIMANDLRDLLDELERRIYAAQSLTMLGWRSWQVRGAPSAFADAMALRASPLRVIIPGKTQEDATEAMNPHINGGGWHQSELPG
jgi:adenylosuccinate lyase